VVSWVLGQSVTNIRIMMPDLDSHFIKFIVLYFRINAFKWHRKDVTVGNVENV
jgi:hypothetical protein